MPQNVRGGTGGIAGICVVLCQVGANRDERSLMHFKAGTSHGRIPCRLPIEEHGALLRRGGLPAAVHTACGKARPHFGSRHAQLNPVKTVDRRVLKGPSQRAGDGKA